MKNQSRKKHNHKELARCILRIIRDERAFHDINLSREGLAERLQVPKALLSQIVREEFQMNFCDLVNKYRIRYAQKLLLSEKNSSSYTLDDIAIMSGFKCRMSMHRAFVKQCGVTPGQARKG